MVSYYKLGVELLDEQTKTPIEHLEYEEEQNFEVAFNIYNSWVTQEDSAKYMYQVAQDGKEKLMFSEGYKNVVELGITQVNLLWDFLRILKEKDYQILRDHGFEWEVKEGFMEMWINDLIDNFCKPLMEYDKDITIVLED